MDFLGMYCQYQGAKTIILASKTLISPVIQNKHVCTEDKCEICDCDCEYDCRSAQTETVKNQNLFLIRHLKG